LLSNDIVPYYLYGRVASGEISGTDTREQSGVALEHRLENPRLGFAMNELKLRIGRREAVRIAILGALVILAGCGDSTPTKEFTRFGLVHRKDKNRQKVLAKLRSGKFDALPPAGLVRRVEKRSAPN
jgi:hypothetical protein